MIMFSWNCLTVSGSFVNIHTTDLLDRYSKYDACLLELVVCVGKEASVRAFGSGRSMRAVKRLLVMVLWLSGTQFRNSQSVAWHMSR